MKRIFLIVLDSCGVGYEPDADKFGDVGSDTLRRCASSAFCQFVFYYKIPFCAGRH